MVDLLQLRFTEIPSVGDGGSGKRTVGTMIVAARKRGLYLGSAPMAGGMAVGMELVVPTGMAFAARVATVLVLIH